MSDRDPIEGTPVDPVPAVLVPLSMVTLWQVAHVAPDARSWYEAHVGPFLAAFGSMTIDAFWQLTVGEHTQLAVHVGLIDDTATRVADALAADGR